MAINRGPSQGREVGRAWAGVSPTMGRSCPHGADREAEATAAPKLGDGPQRARHLIADFCRCTARRSTRVPQRTRLGLAGYWGSSSDRPNGPSSTSRDEKSGGRSRGSNRPTT